MSVCFQVELHTSEKYVQAMLTKMKPGLGVGERLCVSHCTVWLLHSCLDRVWRWVGDHPSRYCCCCCFCCCCCCVFGRLAVSDIEVDLEARERYLAELLEFTRDLPRPFYNINLSVLYHKLQLMRHRRETAPVASRRNAREFQRLFKLYLKIPRGSYAPWVPRRLLEREEYT